MLKGFRAGYSFLSPPAGKMAQTQTQAPARNLQKQETSA